MSTSQEQSATRVFLADSQVVLIQGDREIVRIAVCDIKLIGEYTTSAGPMADDWFIVFMTSAKDWTQISEYTPGMLELLQELGTHLKAELVGTLFASISWKTNIIWPQQVTGREMWSVLTEKPATLIGRLKKALGFASQQLMLTEVAASVFR